MSALVPFSSPVEVPFADLLPRTVVYEIKCILDDVLNAVENTADLLLTELQPVLRGLIAQAAQTSCRSGIQVVGLCLLG